MLAYWVWDQCSGHWYFGGVFRFLNDISPLHVNISVAQSVWDHHLLFLINIGASWIILSSCSFLSQNVLINKGEIFDDIQLWSGAWNSCRSVYQKVPFATWMLRLMLGYPLMPHLILLLILKTKESLRILRLVIWTRFTLPLLFLH